MPEINDPYECPRLNTVNDLMNRLDSFPYTDEDLHAALLEAYDAGQHTGPWKAIADGLPEKDGDYWCYDADSKYDVHYYEDTPGMREVWLNEVVAWQEISPYQQAHGGEQDA